MNRRIAGDLQTKRQAEEAAWRERLDGVRRQLWALNRTHDTHVDEAKDRASQERERRLE